MGNGKVEIPWHFSALSIFFEQSFSSQLVPIRAFLLSVVLMMSTLQRSTLFTVHNRKMRLGKISLIKHLTIPHENHLIIISINLYLALIMFSFYLHNLCRNIITSLCSHRQLYNLHNIMHIISNHHVLWCLYLFPDRSSIKQKTFDPVWNEEFIHEVEGASTLGITVFHKAPLDDVFNANTTISFEDLLARHEQHQKDFWVDLEPSGRLRVKIDLRSSQGEIFSSPSRKNSKIEGSSNFFLQKQIKHHVGGQTKINRFWIDVVEHCDDVFIRSMDTNSWQLFFVSQRFVPIVVSLFGEFLSHRKFVFS